MSTDNQASKGKGARTKLIQVRVTPEEYERARRIADNEAMPVAVLCRTALVRYLKSRRVGT